MADVSKILSNILGQKNAEVVHKTIDEATKTLDAAGVKRKADEGGDGAAPAEGAGGEAILSAVESAGAAPAAQLVKAILDALKGEPLTALEEKLGSNEAVVTLLLKAVSAPAEPIAEAPMEEGMIKSLQDYIASTTKDMGDLARGQLEIAKALKAANEQNAGLVGRMTKLEAQLADRPRQASTASETVVEGKDSKLKQAAEDSIGETAVIAGIRVKAEPAK